ncbi:MAG: GNAT family N-acetyltransferase [Gemmatimonadota bacterium]
MPLFRSATPEDERLLLSLTPQLADFVIPHWRTPEEITRADHPMLKSALHEPSPETTVVVAEEPAGTPVGFVFVSTHYDFFTGQPHAHIEVLAVSPLARGHGLGRALIFQAEAWARSRGYERLTLNVFASNTRARAVYERLNYEAETVHYLKLL